MSFLKIALFVFFLVVLALGITLDVIYHEQVFDYSHDVLLFLAPESKTSITFWKLLSYMGDGVTYKLLPIFLYPFVSRPRFYYYLFGTFAAQIVKITLKLALH